MSGRDGQQQQEEVLSHNEAMLLHEANTKRRSDPDRVGQARVLETVLESDLETSDDGITNLNARDFALSNYDPETDTTEFKWLQEILNIFSKARYPHPRSGLTGLSRAWAAGDAGDRLQPLGLDELARDEAYLMGTFSRAKRGENMKQQETSAKQVQETHAISDRNSSSGGGGIRGRIRKWRN